MKMQRLFFVMALIALSFPCFAAFWDVDLIYGDGFTSGDCSLAVDAGNVPHLSYSVNGSLYYTSKTLGGWSAEAVCGVGFWGGYSALAVSGSGQTCIAFVDGSDPSTNYLKYAYRSGSSWVIETVEDIGWLADYVSLAFNPAGQSCISYCKTTGTYPDTHSYVCFARRTAANSWAKQNVVEVGSVTGPTLAIDARDNQWISFIDSSTGQMKVSTRTATGGWSTQVLDGSTSSPCMGYSFVAVDSENKPSAAYFKNSSGAVQLKYAFKGETWKTETVTRMSDTAIGHCSLVITPEGLPMIAYCDSTSNTLRNAWKHAGTWFTETMDGAEQSGYRPSMKLDRLGNVSTAYLDNWNGLVKIAQAVVPIPLAAAKSKPDGSTVQVSGVVASTGSGELADKLYVQSPDRVSGLQFKFTGSVPPASRGMVLDVQGQITTVDGEKVIVDPLLSLIGTASEPKPLGMKNSNVSH